MKIALVVGHKERSPGACNSNGLCEFEYNNQLVKLINKRLIDGKVESHIVYRNSYLDLPVKINEIEPSHIISFHCNAFNKKASGTEVLYYHRSSTAKVMARTLQDSIVGVLGLPDRGIKPKTAEDRGGYLLKYTHAPCVIVESFFIDNDNDLIIGVELIEELADAISELMLKVSNKKTQW